MSTWATVVVTLGAAAIAVAGTLGATVLQQRFARGERAAAERAEWVRAGAEIIGPIQSLLIDADPERVTINLNDESPMRMKSLQSDRYEGQIRDRLAVLAAAHPHAAVRATSTQLSVALHNSLNTTSWLVRDMLRNREANELERARGEHAAARKLADELTELIRHDEATKEV